MQTNDVFSYRDKGVLTIDQSSLLQVYYPIIKADAYILYQYFQAFYDQGKKQHVFYDILNQTLMNFQRLQEALAILTAVDLVRFYQDDTGYLVELMAPLPREVFLKQGVYRQMLEGIIGQVSVKEMLNPSLDLRDLSKSFSDVFGLETEKPQLEPEKTTFDVDSFKRLMAKDGLIFADEQADVVALYSLCERYKMTWYDCYQLAKETASQHRIQVARIAAKKEQVAVKNDFSEKEQALLAEVKSQPTDMVFAKAKKLKQAVITKDENKTLHTLAEMGFLAEVVSIIVLYTLSKTKSANLNRTYALKVANDLKSKGINQAEFALQALRPRDYTKAAKRAAKKKDNTPDWSNPNYKNTASQRQKMQLDADYQERLKSLTKED